MASKIFFYSNCSFRVLAHAGDQIADQLFLVLVAMLFVFFLSDCRRSLHSSLDSRFSRIHILTSLCLLRRISFLFSVDVLLSLERWLWRAIWFCHISYIHSAFVAADSATASPIIWVEEMEFMINEDKPTLGQMYNQLIWILLHCGLFNNCACDFFKTKILCRIFSSFENPENI